MPVDDHDGHEIGRVANVYLGADEKRVSEGRGPATVSVTEGRGLSPIDRLATLFSPGDRLPEELRERLQRHGFIRIDARGIFTSDCFALPDQIDSVVDGRVKLAASREELIQA